MTIKSEIKRGFKCVLRTYTLSPRFFSTLCRLRFVSTLCFYALSKAEEQAAAVSQTSGAAALQGGGSSSSSRQWQLAGTIIATTQWLAI